MKPLQSEKDNTYTTSRYTDIQNLSRYLVSLRYVTTLIYCPALPPSVKIQPVWSWDTVGTVSFQGDRTCPTVVQPSEVIWYFTHICVRLRYWKWYKFIKQHAKMLPPLESSYIISISAVGGALQYHQGVHLQHENSQLASSPSLPQWCLTQNQSIQNHSHLHRADTAQLY